MKNTLTLILVTAFILAGVVHAGQTSGPRSVLLYAARLTQEGEHDPEATVFINQLGGDVVWTRRETGEYIGALQDAFSENTYCAAPVRDNSGDVTTGSAAVFTIDRSGNGGVIVNSYGTPEDGSLQHRDIEGSIFVKIEVYP